MKKKVKPIFTVGVSNINGIAGLIEVKNYIEKILQDDYHVLIYSTICEDFKFECFNISDIDEIKFEEFKKQFLKEIELKE